MGAKRQRWFCWPLSYLVNRSRSRRFQNSWRVRLLLNRCENREVTNTLLLGGLIGTEFDLFSKNSLLAGTQQQVESCDARAHKKTIETSTIFCIDAPSVPLPSVYCKVRCFSKSLLRTNDSDFGQSSVGGQQFSLIQDLMPSEIIGHDAALEDSASIGTSEFDSKGIAAGENSSSTELPRSSGSQQQSANRQAGETLGATSQGATTVSEDDTEPLPNQAPLAVNDVATVLEDAAVDIPVFANDSDPDLGDHLKIATWDDATGNATITQPDIGVLRYRPNPDFNGSDTFSYTIMDDRGTTSTATVVVTVTAVNDPCVAFNDAAAAPTHATNITGSVLDNDYDYDSPDATFATIRVSAVNTAGLSGTLDFNYATGEYV